MIHLRIILKSGVEFTTKAEKYTAKWDNDTQLTNLEVKGCTENFPVYLDLAEVSAVVRVFSNERGETNE